MIKYGSHYKGRASRAVSLGVAVVALIASAASGRADGTLAKQMADPAVVESMIASWKTQPQELARKLVAKYGAPSEATKTRLIWFNNGP